MRTPAILSVLTLALGSAAVGCQILAGLTVLEVDAGGEGGAGSAGSTSTAGTGGAACKAEDCGNFACNPSGTACATTCKGPSDCSSHAICAQGTKMCVPCGTYPPMGMCIVGATCTTCDPSTSPPTCDETCGAPGSCDKNQTLVAMMGPVQLQCEGQCADVTITCQGPFPCEIVCEDGGCKGLTMMCDPQGPCTLTCHGSSCLGAFQNCGGNTCTASCATQHPGPDAITQMCSSSCACANTKCQ